MTMYQFRELDERGHAHFEAVLSYANPLGRRIGETLSLSTSGKVFAVVPIGLVKDPYQFKRGVLPTGGEVRLGTVGGYAERVGSTDEMVSGWLHQVLSLHPEWTF